MSQMKLLKVLLVAVVVMALALVPISAKKNVVVWGMLGDNETLNPILSENSSETDVMNGIFSKLITMTDKLEMVPDLLTKMPAISKDNLTYTFQLRKGVTFHDGVELTTTDVKFTYDMKMAKGNAVPSRAMWERIQSFDIIDKYNFKITLNKTDATWLEGWCYSEGNIVPKHILEKEFKAGGDSLTKGGAFSRNPVGSGPYRFVEWKTDQYIMLKKYDKYFRKGFPKIETVIFKVVPDTNALFAQIKNGDIDIYHGAQPSQYKEYLEMKELQVFKNPAFIYMHADFNFRNPIFKDKRVRQALCYAFPKQMFIDTVLLGIGTPADSNIVPMSWAYNPKVRKYDYNRDKAKQLLDEAGWKVGADGVREKDGVKMSFKISTNSGNKTREKFNEIAKQEWEAIGAKVEIQNYEAATLFGDILENLKFDIIVFGWVSGADPDCYSLWSTKQIPDENEGQGQNYIAYRNSRIDYLVEAGQTELNKEKRKKIYMEIQEILAEEVPYMFVYYYNTIDVLKNGLKNFKPNPTQANATWNLYEWEWQ